MGVKVKRLHDTGKAVCGPVLDDKVEEEVVGRERKLKTELLAVLAAREGFGQRVTVFNRFEGTLANDESADNDRLIGRSIEPNHVLLRWSYRS
jgi:hypothetical protein